MEKTFDLVCIGRAAVDLYGEQLGSPLEDVQTFKKSLGGCAANIAVGSSRQGLKVAMLARVGDEHMGRFVRRQLAAEGVDVRWVTTDPERLTALVLLSIRDRDTFPLIFYRENCADMALEPADVDPLLLGATRAVLLTGTHFSRPNVDAASRKAIALGRAAGAKIIFDIDYRPVLWKLTGHGAGENRFVENAEVTAHIQTIVGECDLIVGTEQEIHLAGGATDTIEALRAIRARSGATIVLKRGPLGCAVFSGDIPARVEDTFVGRGVEVEVLNVLGAGDAFLSGFLRGWVRGEPLEACALYANACGALVVSRHSCSPAMPSKVELDDYVARRAKIPRIDRDLEIAHLHRTTNRERATTELCVLAFDHRLSFEKLAERVGASSEKLPALKLLIAAAASRASLSRGLGAEGRPHAGMIIDDKFGLDALHRWTGTNFWLARPIEEPSEPNAPLELSGAPNPELYLLTWPKSQVIKCLAYYHPDAPDDARRATEEELLRLYHMAVALDRELLLEIIPQLGDRADAEVLPRALDMLYARGLRPDWWKLPPPREAAAWQDIDAVLEARDPHCRGVLLLGLDAAEEELAASFRASTQSRKCRGFAVGRTIFGRPSERWLTGAIDDAALIAEVASSFERMIELWMTRGSGT